MVSINKKMIFYKKQAWCNRPIYGKIEAIFESKGGLYENRRCLPVVETAPD